MQDILPHCKHCHSTCIIGKLANKYIALCTVCDNGFAIAANTPEQLTEHHNSTISTQHLRKTLSTIQNHVVQQINVSLEDIEKHDYTTQVELTAEQKNQKYLLLGIQQGTANLKELIEKSLQLI
ncbi:hypothetical protein CWB96_00220 [Pseudoalteromonas citrea]|uniref:Uncharacterized protein n=1 Tax=Pseudoalteromonas citrea TaxID=43655 RepID=A0A5S3XVE0_9GAMM|nr:hypothetical protein [Pseudoalteromonas citrea]TMP46291.1 hypothetical protein CWB97_02215 [Pseudoalteromonas citrea]TMP63067.1 hypothetical protein CWB96_00220 [Pseudoalteromonas citrea]